MIFRRSPCILNNALIFLILDKHIAFTADIVDFNVILNTFMTFLVEVEDDDLVVAVILREDGVEGELEHERFSEVEGLNNKTKWKLIDDLLEVVKRVQLSKGLTLGLCKSSI